ncbi:MAG: hypothetical protein ACJAZP_002331 [Psychromonas sp.]|jgi:hypothetical protein
MHTEAAASAYFVGNISYLSELSVITASFLEAIIRPLLKITLAFLIFSPYCSQ